MGAAVTPDAKSATPGTAGTTVDAVVIGAGFSGLYMLRRLRDDLGLRVRVIEAGHGVGGTWYWNRYPGARCDAESIYYSYGFDDDLQQEWTWTERYASQPEILAYAEHVAEHFELTRDIVFGTRVTAARWNEMKHQWTVCCDDEELIGCRYLISAMGCLSAARIPSIPGQDLFSGESYHTGRWPRDGVDVTGKRVAVIGTGSSGIQAIPVLAEQAAQLTVFQRTAHYSVPARNRPLAQQEIAEVKATYPELRAVCRTTPAGTALDSAENTAADLTAEQRAAMLTEKWERGGPGIIGVFRDVMTDAGSNAVVADFVRARIAEVIDDPDVARLLSPTDYPIGTKRICVDTDYFATFNRDNVNLVSIKDTPIQRISPSGVLVDDVEYPADVIVYATGYDAMTGALDAIELHGRDGVSLKQKWADGPQTYLGVTAAGFPNFFVLTGPGSPSVLTNMMTSIEQHVDFVTDLLRHLETVGAATVEPEAPAERAWGEQVATAAGYTLYPRAESWYMGANVPGKPQVFMPYVGGCGGYRKICDDVAADSYRGFVIGRTTETTEAAAAM